MSKFKGPLEELRAVVESTGIVGEWVSDGSKHCFRGQNGEILNWWQNTGTLQYQGQRQAELRAALTEALGGGAPVRTIQTATPAPKSEATKIFIVHGHDREAREQLELVLRRLDLQPFILQNSDGGTKTIIEALEQNIYKDSAFGIVLLTPDDFGYSKNQTEADRKPRARQNVILEMGMVMAALGRGRMAILQRGTLERPSDTDGILRLEFNTRVQEIVPALVQRLQSAGIAVDGNKIAAAAA